MKDSKFDGSGLNHIDTMVKEDILSELAKKYPWAIEALKIKDCHLYIYQRGGKILLNLGFYGLQPSRSSDITWEVTKGVTFETKEDFTTEVDYFGGDTYLHDDFYRVEGQPIELF